MLQNLVAGLQGVVDHALVGNLLGFAANAGIGVAWQIFLVVIVFMASLFTGQAVLVARFAGAGDHDKVNRVVYQAFIASVGMYAVLALIGYFAAPFLLHPGQRRARGAGPGPAVPRINFVVQHRHAAVLHAVGGAAGRRRRAHAAAPGHHP